MENLKVVELLGNNRLVFNKRNIRHFILFPFQESRSTSPFSTYKTQYFPSVFKQIQINYHDKN